MNTLREKTMQLLQLGTVAEQILDELSSMDVSEDNYVDFFDAVNVIEIYENDIRRRRMSISLRMKTCVWLRYKDDCDLEEIVQGNNLF
jgi:hypothetical protein